MQSKFFCHILRLLLFLAFVALPSAKADTIPLLTVNESGGNTSIDYIQGEQGPIGPQFTAFAFVLGQRFDDVSITLENALIEGNFQAWLTNAIGPAATDENVIASQDLTDTFTGVFGAPVLPETFFDVDLGPGTYFVTLNGFLCDDPDVCSGQFDWYGGTTATITSLPDVALAGVYLSQDSYVPLCTQEGNCNLNFSSPYASIWNGPYAGPPGELEIDGEPVPEPATLAVSLVGVLLIFWSYRRRTRTSG